MRCACSVVFWAFLAAMLFEGCTRSSANQGVCKMVQGRPYPEKGAMRFEGTFDVTVPGIEAVLLVDGSEADRVALPIGEGQKLTLKCDGLAQGEHRFELKSMLKEVSVTRAKGIVVVK